MANLESAMKEEGLTFWGAPPNFDGHLYPVFPFYVDSIANIPAEGWKAILTSKALTWVVIPWETADGPQ